MNLGAESWQGYLSSRFVGYLLPASAASRLDEAAARLFLRRLTRRANALDLLRSIVALAPHAARFTTFAERLLPDLLRCLPSRNTVVVRRWEGGYHGRLDIRRTLEQRLGGSASTFITSARRRDHDLPENVLLRAVVERLAREIANLHQAKALAGTGWGAGYLERLAVLRRVLGFGRLAEVATEPIRADHLAAAKRARHPCHREAAWWWLDMEESRTDDPERLARLVATSALSPLDEPTRFELAVLVKLIEEIEQRLCSGGGWAMEQCLVLPDRDEVARFVGRWGLVVRVFYNQAELPAGPADLGARHYLGRQGRLRPDVTVTIERDGKRVRAHVLEIKHSSDPDYVLEGLHEAILYAHEYGPELSGWPKAMLVCSSKVAGSVRRADPVVAVDWDHWVPKEIGDALLDGLSRPASVSQPPP